MKLYLNIVPLPGVSPLLCSSLCPPALLSMDTFDSAAICHLSYHFSPLVFHGHLLLVIIQHAGLCVNCAAPWIFSPNAAPPSQLDIFVHFLSNSLHKPHPSWFFFFLLPCDSLESGIFLTPARPRSESKTVPGKDSACPSVCPAAQGDAPGTCCGG